MIRIYINNDFEANSTSLMSNVQWANVKFFPEPTGELYGWLLATLVSHSLAVSTAVTMADEEEEVEEDAMCPPGKHKWLNDKCMVCTMCGECTGYGSSCITTGRPQRNPGL